MCEINSPKTATEAISSENATHFFVLVDLSKSKRMQLSKISDYITHINEFTPCRLLLGGDSIRACCAVTSYELRLLWIICDVINLCVADLNDNLLFYDEN